MKNNTATIEMGHYVRSLVNHVVQAYQGIQPLLGVRIQSDPLTFSIDTAVPLGMIVTELVSNVLRHAFPEGKQGELSVTLKTLDDTFFQLCVADNGMGIDLTDGLTREKSLGLDLVETFTAQLEGNLDVDNDEGTRVRVSFRDVKRLF